MIGSLRGTVLEHGPGAEVLVEVAGVGYRVAVSPRTLAGLAPSGTEAFLYVHHHQREDAQTLYGFPTRDERACFEALLRATGVGPALALAITAVLTPVALRAAVVDGDLDALCGVPGVGKKTAARLLIELKSRFDGGGTDVVAAVVANGAGPGSGPLRSVREALVGLGYSADEIKAALAGLPAGGADAAAAADPGTLLRDALGRLAVARA